MDDGLKGYVNYPLQARLTGWPARSQSRGERG